MEQASDMLQELNQEKTKLDGYCNDLHALYDEVIIDDPENASIVFEKHLRRDVNQLSQEIPKIEQNIKDYQNAQKKLYQARELIETAMKSLPGATKFLDRQGIATTHNNADHSTTTTFSIKHSDALAQKSYTLVEKASNICTDVPLIPISPIGKGETVILALTHYRGYRLKIESILRRQLNPRLHQFETQLSVARYQYEQRLIEWIDHQIITLEMHLRVNGVLQDNLEREISMLRMGSRAAMVAVASEASGRVTVDDVLDITTESVLPQYTNNESSSTASSSSSSLSSHHQESNGVGGGIQIYQSQNLPTYAIRQSDDHPPAYSQ
ncbi:hypothetical protein K501DRAFT_244031 [Backusella circina FSU 941]|nr:hypothetical protein K501DRAFT_244031 [Backusella circina FSU 941]